MNKRVLLSIKDVLESINRIDVYTEGVDYDSFFDIPNTVFPRRISSDPWSARGILRKRIQADPALGKSVGPSSYAEDTQ